MPEVVDIKKIAKTNLLVTEQEVEELRALLKLYRKTAPAKGAKYNLVPPFAGKPIKLPPSEPRHAQTPKLRSEQ